MRGQTAVAERLIGLSVFFLLERKEAADKGSPTRGNKTEA